LRRWVCLSSGGLEAFRERSGGKGTGGKWTSITTTGFLTSLRISRRARLVLTPQPQHSPPSPLLPPPPLSPTNANGCLARTRQFFTHKFTSGGARAVLERKIIIRPDLGLEFGVGLVQIFEKGPNSIFGTLWAAVFYFRCCFELKMLKEAEALGCTTRPNNFPVCL
jgi:hypothetical protein